MKAAFITGYGPKQKLVLGKFPIPDCGPNDVLVEIHAASINPIDFKIRDGKLKFLRSFNFPLVLGHDLAGVVTSVGARVTKFNLGDEVYSRPQSGRIGTFAEMIAID